MCVAASSYLVMCTAQFAVKRSRGHVLIELVFQGETLLTVEDLDAEIVALLPQLFAAWLAHGGDCYDLVCGDVHLELISCTSSIWHNLESFLRILNKQ